jgi:hypothetical protein
MRLILISIICGFYCTMLPSATAIGVVLSDTMTTHGMGVSQRKAEGQNNRSFRVKKPQSMSKPETKMKGVDLSV